MKASARLGLKYTPLLKIKLNADASRGEAILAALHAEFPQGGAGSWALDANAAWTPAVALAYLEAIKRGNHKDR